MNILNKTKCYLVGHMEHTPDGRSWREYVAAALNDIGVTTFDPYHKPFINARKEDEEARKHLKENMLDGKFDLVAEHMKQVRAEDLRICDLSDFIFAVINPKVASWGSAEEIFWSNRMKKPIFIVIEGGKKQAPLWLMGTIPHKYFYNDIEEALTMIKNIDCGHQTIDSDRWKLLREELR